LILPRVNEEALDGLKFSECLPAEVATEVVRSRIADEQGIADVLGRPTKVVSETGTRISRKNP
jgi:ATP-dependent Lhr-like helicase